MSDGNKKRVLRLGIIQGGNIVEERLLRNRDTISIGQGPRNTFIVPIPQLPKSYTLFESTSNGYHLIYEEHMEGRIHLGSDQGDEIIDLRAAARAGRVKQRGGLFVLPLPDSSRGKVAIGNVTILFQFVDAPVRMPNPVLPASAKGVNINWAFLYILLFSFLLQGGAGMGAWLYWEYDGQYREDPLKARQARRYALLEELRLKAKEKKEEEKKEEKKEDKTKDSVEKTPPKKKAKKKRRVTKRSVARKKTRSTGKTDRKALRDRVKKSTALGVLLSTGKGPSAFDKSLAAARSNDDDAAFVGTGRNKAGLADSSGAFDGKNKLGKKSQELKSIKGRGKRIATDRIERTAKKKTRIKIRPGRVGGKTGLGRIDAGKVQSVFRRRSSAIRTCYEKGLKSNPNLRGKVKIRFTISTSGRVTSIRVASNSTGSSSVANCIIGKVRRWRFPQPEGGTATFSNSFLLTK
jgi:TonB family protein